MNKECEGTCTKKIRAELNRIARLGFIVSFVYLVYIAACSWFFWHCMSREMVISNGVLTVCLNVLVMALTTAVVGVVGFAKIIWPSPKPPEGI